MLEVLEALPSLFEGHFVVSRLGVAGSNLEETEGQEEEVLGLEEEILLFGDLNAFHHSLGDFN